MRIDKSTRRIAEAFYAVASRGAEPSAIIDLVDRTSRLFSQAPTLRQAFYSDRLDPARKKELLDRAVGAGLGPYALGLVHTLVDEGMERKLFKVLAYARRLAEQAEAAAVVEVVSASPLSSEVKREIERLARELKGSDVAIRERVEEDLIGGLVVRVGDRLFDGSVRGRLERFRKAVSERL